MGSWVVTLFGYSLSIIFAPVLVVGWYFLCLESARGKDIKSSDIFKTFSHFGTVLATYYLFLLIVLAGTFLLIIPGIIWAFKYGLSLFAVMDRKLSAREAIKFSGKITKGYKGKLFCTGIIFHLLSLLALPLSLGLSPLMWGGEPNYVLIIAGIIPYLVSLLVISPWAGTTFATAYDCLARREGTS